MCVFYIATFPYLMMTVLLVRGLTLNGAWDGIQYYLTPDFNVLMKGQVGIHVDLHAVQVT